MKISITSRVIEIFFAWIDPVPAYTGQEDQTYDVYKAGRPTAWTKRTYRRPTASEGNNEDHRYYAKRCENH